MTLFKYTTTMDDKIYQIEADYYEFQQQTTVNLRGEESTVTMCVFYKGEKIMQEIPSLYLHEIREVV